MKKEKNSKKNTGKNPLRISIDKDGFMKLNDFYSLIDVNKVEYYIVESHLYDGTALIYFYDKNKKLIKPYKQPNESDDSFETLSSDLD